MAMWRRSGLAAIHSLRRRSPSLLCGAAPPPPLPRRSPELSGTLLGAPSKSFFELVPARSFAAPVQAKPKTKPENDPTSGPRVNGAITVPFVRLVTDEGHSIVSTKEALDHAMRLNLDLVEVQRTAKPPVCKIMDFHKEKYKQEIKEKERVKTKAALTLRGGENKEVRFKAKTELKDLKVKAEAIIRLMERGYRVKCTAMPGKEEDDLGGLLSRLLTLIADVSVVESGPHVDPNKAYVIVRHAKFASKKSGKKVSEVLDTVSKGVQSAVSQSSVSQDATPHEDDNEEWEPDESYSETDVDEKVVAKAQDRGFISKESVRSNTNVANDFEKLLNLDARGNGIDSRPNLVKPKLDMERAKKEEPATTVDTNSYSKRNQGPCVLYNNKQREPYPSNQTSPHPSYRNVAPGSRDEAKLNRLPTGNPNNPRPPPKSYGIFSTPKATTTTEQKNTGDAAATKSYGIFSNKTAEKPSNSSSPTPKSGLFDSAKKEGSSDRSNPADADSGNTSNQSSPTPRYGVFSSKRAATSNN